MPMSSKKYVTSIVKHESKDIHTSNEKVRPNPLRSNNWYNRCQSTFLLSADATNGDTRLVPRKHWYISGPPMAASFLSCSLKRTFSVSLFSSMSKNSGSFEP